MFNCFKKRIIKKHPYKVGSNVLCLIVGHTKARQGARSYHGKTEYEVNKEFAHLIAEYSSRLGLHVIVHFRDFVGITGAYLDAVKQDPFAICELHFNAFDGTVSGCEVLYSDINDKKPVLERRLATMALDTISYVLGNRKRGIKNKAKKGERGFYNVSQVSNVPSILIEPYFGDNKKDFDNYWTKQRLLAQKLAEMFYSFHLIVKKGE